MSTAKRTPTRMDCPCCGYATLAARNAYNVCKLCNWEDDGQGDEDADDIRGGPNADYSLTEARANFKRYRVMYAPGLDPRAIGAASQLEFDTKGHLMAALDRLRRCEKPEGERLNFEIAGLERTLYEETLRRVLDFDREQLCTSRRAEAQPDSRPLETQERSGGLPVELSSSKVLALWRSRLRPGALYSALYAASGGGLGYSLATLISVLLHVPLAVEPWAVLGALAGGMYGVHLAVMQALEQHLAESAERGAAREQPAFPSKRTTCDKCDGDTQATGLALLPSLKQPRVANPTTDTAMSSTMRTRTRFGLARTRISRSRKRELLS